MRRTCRARTPGVRTAGVRQKDKPLDRAALHPEGSGPSAFAVPAPALQPLHRSGAGYQRTRRRGRAHPRLGEPRSDRRGRRPPEGRRVFGRHRPARRAAPSRPRALQHADLVFMESTYGDKDHPSLAQTAVLAREAVKAAVEERGRVLVPTFAIGRSQLLLYLLAGAFKRRDAEAVPDLPRQPDGDPRHRDLQDARRSVRRRGHCDAALRRSVEEPPHRADLPEGQGLAGARPKARAVDGAGRRRHVHGRPHSEPPAEPSARSDDARPDGRLSVARVGGARAGSMARRRFASPVRRSRCRRRRTSSAA